MIINYYMGMNIFLKAASCLMFFCLCSCDSGETIDEEPQDPLNTFFKDEVRPSVQDCFDGAYYRKAVSSKDKWLGIGGTVVLPQIEFDEDRKNPNKPGQYLDNPSVYLGGCMGGQETDIGLTWEVVKENGVVSQERKAFRPFMRRTSHISGQESNYSNAPAEEKYYWYPSEEVSISIQIVDDYKLKFIVEGAGKRFETDYECAGYKKGNIGEFKRVNAIDQVANEGKPVQPTHTQIKNSCWKETYLFRLYKDEVVKAPMHKERFTDMRCPDDMYFSIEASEEESKQGGECITINGKGY